MRKWCLGVVWLSSPASLVGKRFLRIYFFGRMCDIILRVHVVDPPHLLFCCQSHCHKPQPTCEITRCGLISERLPPRSTFTAKPRAHMRPLPPKPYSYHIGCSSSCATDADQLLVSSSCYTYSGATATLLTSCSSLLKQCRPLSSSQS